MWSNYLKIAIRAIGRNKLFTFINVFGLSIGMAASIILLLYIDYEFSYDKYILNSKRVFEVCYKGTTGQLFATAVGPVAPYIKEKYPEIESFTRVSAPNWEKKIIVNVAEKSFAETRCYLVDSSFFDIFECQLISGSFSQFSANNKVVILTEKTAIKYFNSVNVIGKSITVNENTPLIIIGVIKDIPENSHFKYDLLIPISWVEKWYAYANLKAWESSNLYCSYIKLKKNTNVDILFEKIKGDIPRMDEQVSQWFQSIFFEPLRKIHTDNVQRNYEKGLDLNYLYIYFGIALVILVVACINFMNLLTAIYLNRGREVGLRKVIGANRKQIRIQFISESILITFMALFFAIIIVESALPLTNQFYGANIFLDYLNFKFLLFAIGFILFVGFASGIYPAFFISGIQPAIILKSGFKAKKSNLLIKNALIVFQFVITIALIISSSTFYLQLRHIQSIDVGYNRKNLLMIPTYTKNLAATVPELKRLIKQNPNIIAVSANSFLPSVNSFYQSIWYEGEPYRYSKMMSHISVDEDFFETYQIQLLEGTNFSYEDKGMQHDYILNESAVKDLDWEENPIGKKISIYGPENQGTVIGVVKDVNFKSLHVEVTPCLFHPDIQYFEYSYLSVRIKKDKIEPALEYIEKKWQEINPKYPFEYFFAEDDFSNMYKADMRTNQLIGAFSFLSIVISCLGLFGLIAYTAQQRSKEISIRKVFGASSGKIVFLLSANYAKLLLISNLIAWPVSFIILDRWLQNFHYRIQMPWWVYIGAGLITITIAILTISYQAVKTANTNPAKTLKFE